MGVDSTQKDTPVKGWSQPFERLRRKWSEVPAGNDERITNERLLALSDSELKESWVRANAHDVNGEGFGIRGWFHRIYRPILNGKKVLDIGSGFAVSTMDFALQGARLTFSDISLGNLKVLERLSAVLGVRADFHYIENIASFASLPCDYDFVTAIGSLINAPAPVIRDEVQAILPHLRVGGRWLHFAYPKSRWQREGSLPFSQWGEKTDGPGTPWMEFHERETMDYFFAPARMRLLFECAWHDGDFNWFDYELTER